jgi:hypothetical protein
MPKTNRRVKKITSSLANYILDEQIMPPGVITQSSEKNEQKS